MKIICARFRALHRISRRLYINVFALSLAQALTADEVTKWNDLACRLALSNGLANPHPLFLTRMLAMTQTAVHDALNSIDRRYRSYSVEPNIIAGASPEAAVATAAYTVLRDQFSQIAAFGFVAPQQELTDAYNTALALIPQSQAKALGIGVGQAAASQILSLRAGDRAYLLPPVDPNFPQGTAPGEYRFTTGFSIVFQPQWGTLSPFALDYAGRFQSSRPYPVNSKRYAEDYIEIKNLGGDGITTASSRTADQTQIALFWLESSPIGWNRVARTVTASRGLGLWENARMFALLNIALADGYIASFHDKYFYKFWRPETAIRLGDSDGNAETAGDPAWTPLARTPPIPDHDSAHAVEGGAAAAVLERIFGSQRIPFQTCSTTVPAGGRCGDPQEVKRTYSSFAQASLENGLSRIYVGFHFRRAVTEGIEHGRKIGRWAAQHYLQPIED